MTKKGYEIGSRNVFKDIGVPNAEEPGSIKGDVKKKHRSLCWRRESSLTSSPFRPA
jgi:hypothetical protein